MRVAIVDYGASNLFSITSAFERAGADVRLISYSDSEAALAEFELVVLPGVGSFGPAARNLSGGLGDRIARFYADGGTVFGVCLGMHLMFESSEEGEGRGLSILRGAVRRIRGRRVPHIGWSYTRPVKHSRLFDGVEGGWYYYAHSYAADTDLAVAEVEHEGQALTAAVELNGLVATQFHPEKSGPAGAVIIRNVMEIARR